MWQFDGEKWEFRTRSIRASVQPSPAGNGWTLALAREGVTTYTEHATVQEAQAQAQPMFDLYAPLAQEEM